MFLCVVNRGFALPCMALLLLLLAPLAGQQLLNERDKAIARIKEWGGKVQVDGKRPGSPVISVDLSHVKVADITLETLNVLPTLEQLALRNTPVTDDGIIKVQGLTHLEVLELSQTQITDKGVAQLQRFPRLRKLDLSGTQVSDEAMRHLTKLI